MSRNYSINITPYYSNKLSSYDLRMVQQREQFTWKEKNTEDDRINDDDVMASEMTSAVFAMTKTAAREATSS